MEGEGCDTVYIYSLPSGPKLQLLKMSGANDTHKLQGKTETLHIHSSVRESLLASEPKPASVQHWYCSSACRCLCLRELISDS